MFECSDHFVEHQLFKHSKFNSNCNANLFHFLRLLLFIFAAATSAATKAAFAKRRIDVCIFHFDSRSFVSHFYSKEGKIIRVKLYDSKVVF